MRAVNVRPKSVPTRGQHDGATAHNRRPAVVNLAEMAARRLPRPINRVRKGRDGAY